jgi:hypothetical protein
MGRSCAQPVEGGRDAEFPLQGAKEVVFKVAAARWRRDRAGLKAGGFRLTAADE